MVVLTLNQYKQLYPQKKETLPGKMGEKPGRARLVRRREKTNEFP
jgi:hypothetical protein